MKLRTVVILLGLGGLAIAGYQSGVVEPYLEQFAAKSAEKPEPAKTEPPVPAVSVVKAAQSDFVETIPVTGSFAAREEILVAPEVDGLRVSRVRII